MNTINEEDFNILTLLRVTQSYCSSPLDALEHILDMSVKAVRELPVEFAKIEDAPVRELERTFREKVGQCIDLLCEVRDDIEWVRLNG